MKGQETRIKITDQPESLNENTFKKQIFLQKIRLVELYHRDLIFFLSSFFSAQFHTLSFPSFQQHCSFLFMMLKSKSPKNWYFSCFNLIFDYKVPFFVPTVLTHSVKKWMLGMNICYSHSSFFIFHCSQCTVCCWQQVPLKHHFIFSLCHCDHNIAFICTHFNHTVGRKQLDPFSSASQ